MSFCCVTTARLTWLVGLAASFLLAWIPQVEALPPPGSMPPPTFPPDEAEHVMELPIGRVPLNSPPTFTILTASPPRVTPAERFKEELKQVKAAVVSNPASQLAVLEQFLLDHPGFSWELLPVLSRLRVDALLALGRCEQARVMLNSLVEAPPLPQDQEIERSWARQKLSTLQCPEWVSLPGGTFIMGKIAQAHRVTVPAFEMMRTEVSAAEYERCVQGNGCLSSPVGDGGCTYGKALLALHPVNCVSRVQAQEYCRWAGGRLPTEAEWEWAAAGGREHRKYPWGNIDPIKAEPRTNLTGDLDPFPETAPMCSFPAGHSKHGLCDLAGNVWEWVEDCWHQDFRGAPIKGEAWNVGCVSPPLGVLRGGSFVHDAGQVRIRLGVQPKDSYVDSGFRCVRSPRQP